MACLLTRVFTFDHLFNHRSDVFNNLAISLTKWPEYRKNRCLSCSTNSVRLHFRQRAEKTKENGKNTKIENLQNGQEIYGGKKTSVRAHLGKKLKYIYFLQILVASINRINIHWATKVTVYKLEGLMSFLFTFLVKRISVHFPLRACFTLSVHFAT